MWCVKSVQLIAYNVMCLYMYVVITIISVYMYIQVVHDCVFIHAHVHTNPGSKG